MPSLIPALLALTIATPLSSDNTPFTARLVPVVRYGQMTGFKLFSIRPGSIYDRLGLQNRDIIRTMNGIPVRDVDDLLRAFSAVDPTQGWSIQIERSDHILLLEPPPQPHLRMLGAVATCFEGPDDFARPIRLIPRGGAILAWSYGPDGFPDTADDVVMRARDDACLERLRTLRGLPKDSERPRAP